jgi:arogenate dehydrogenase (NADP+)
MLGAMELTSTEINTRGFEALLQLVENTNHDSFDLYYGLFLYNTNATGLRAWLCGAVVCCACPWCVVCT